MAEGGKTNRSPNINWVIELWLGGEHSEGQKINPVRDVRKSALTDPGRSDAVHVKWYNGTDAASEVSWIIVPSHSNCLSAREGSTLEAMLKPDYVLGLVDGEGSFTVYIRDPDLQKIVKRRVRAEPRFYLKLIEKDKNILYELKEFFGCGNIYFQGDRRRNHQNCYRYEVTHRRDLEEAIIPFFRRNKLKLPSKRNDFEIFCKLIGMINQGLHLNPSGLRKMYNLKRAMH